MRTQPAQNSLMHAVLVDALHCLNGAGCVRPIMRKRLKSEAAEWVFSADEAPFSFVNVCEVLGFDADRLRERLREASIGSLGHRAAGRRGRIGLP